MWTTTRTCIKVLTASKKGFQMHLWAIFTLLILTRLTSREGGPSLIFVYRCTTSRSLTPPFDKVRQRRNFEANLRKSKQKVPEMCDSVDLRKLAFFRGETSNFSKKGPFCKALLGPKRNPFISQNVKSGPLCKAFFVKPYLSSDTSVVYHV